MKRFLALCMAGFMLISATACGAKDNRQTSDNPKPNDKNYPAKPIDLSKIDISSKRDYCTTFSIGPRGDVFFAKQDGTVWDFTYGDGYACFDGSNQGMISERPIYAFDARPVRMVIEEHGGVLIDNQGTLWGWGAFSKENGSFDKIIGNVTDVQLSFYEALILREDGTLWLWLRNGAIPELLAENIHASGCSTYPLALKENGELVMLELILNYNSTAVEKVREKKIMDNVLALDDGFIYTRDGTLYTFDENQMPVKHFVGAVQAVACDEGIVVLDASGNIWLQNSLSEPLYITGNAKKLITYDEILYISNEQELCRVLNGEVTVLDTDILEATTGYRDNGVTHSIFYSKGDGDLWRIGIADGEQFKMEPELITNQLLTLEELSK